MAIYKKLFISLLALLSLAAFAETAALGQQRKTKKPATKKNAQKTAQSKRETNVSQLTPQISERDISVKIERRKNLIFTRLTLRVLVIVNRDKRPIEIRKVTLNEEYEFAGSKIKMKHSEKGYFYLPVTLKLGESLENVFPDDYKKQVVYVDLETDSGVRQFKIEDWLLFYARLLREAHFVYGRFKSKELQKRGDRTETHYLRSNIWK